MRGREAKAASQPNPFHAQNQCKHLFLQWLTLNWVKVWETTGKASTSSSICCRTFCKAMHRSSPEKKGGWIPDSPAIISTPLHLTRPAPHCRWDDAAAHHQLRARGQCNLVFLCRQKGRGGKIVPAPLGRPITATLPKCYRYRPCTRCS